MSIGMKSKLSLTMIVKDETDSLVKLFESLKNIPFDDKVILITESNKETFDICNNFGAWIFRVHWTDNFSEARQKAMDQTPADYIFWIDADDTLENADKFMQEYETFLKSGANALCMPYHYRFDKDGNLQYDFLRERIVKKSDFYWKGAIHEGLHPKEGIVMNVYTSNSVYIKHHPKNDANRFERNLRIAKKAYDKEKTSDTILSYAISLVDAGKEIESLSYLEEYLRQENLHPQYRYMATMMMANICISLAEHKLEKARKLYPKLGEPTFKEAEIAWAKQDFQKAIELCEKGFYKNLPINWIVPWNYHNYTLRPSKVYSDSLYQNGNIEKSNAVIDHALKTFPKDEWLNKRKKKFLRINY